MHRMLLDTNVWLDLAKDPAQLPLFAVLEELVAMEEISLIVPSIVRDEYFSNKARIVKEAGQSMSHVFKRVKDVVERLGDSKKKKIVIEQLNNIDYKIPFIGESVSTTMARIEVIFKKADIIEPSTNVKMRAIQRAISKNAPFHRNKNSINDAIIIETYAECLNDARTKGDRFYFITHNKADFSHPSMNEKIPHPDFDLYFSKIRSRYFIKLSEAIQKVSPGFISQIMIEEEWIDDQRSLAEILKMQNELTEKIWYNRHQVSVEKINAGEIRIVKRSNWSLENSQKTYTEDIWKSAKRAALKVEQKYGRENLGPWDDFEWGMLNGKLSALRWVLGEDWDSLYT